MGKGGAGASDGGYGSVGDDGADGDYADDGNDNSIENRNEKLKPNASKGRAVPGGDTEGRSLDAGEGPESDVLTDGGDEDDGVEERAGEGPLLRIEVLGAVPAVVLDGADEGTLEQLEPLSHRRRPHALVQDLHVVRDDPQVVRHLREEAGAGSGLSFTGYRYLSISI